MMNFLKKYWLNIILLLLLFGLTFWLIPGQEKLYLKSDYDLILKRAFTFLIWTLSLGALTILILALREIGNWKQVGNVLIGLVAVAIPFFFILKPIILSDFLLLNRINVGKIIERQYSAAFFVEGSKRTPLVYDFREQRTVALDNVENLDKLYTLKTGDTLTMSFQKGLLGFPFDPKLK
jgi:Na+/H+-dicarboxylate symporter